MMMSSNECGIHSPISDSTHEQELITRTLNSSERFSQDAHILVNACLDECSQLYPPYLAGAIRRVPDLNNQNSLAASIAMVFPDYPSAVKFGCQMTLEIMPNKVEHVGREIFQAHIETTGGLRYIYLPGGTKILPQPQVTIQGCPHSAISLNFGNETFQAIRANPAYQDEVRQGRDRTDCVSMVVSHKADEGALILLSLAPREGTLIRDRLYK